MSDVSGIPYLGPMGQGNLFASPYPALSGGGNMSAEQIASPYMPQVNYNQSVFNNLFNTPGGGGGFGRATDYYSQLGAQYSAAGMSPYGVFSDMSGGGASPYHTTPDVWNTGASNVSYPGAGAIDWGGLFGSVGGASPYQTSPNVFSQGASGMQFPGVGLDWSSMYQAPQQSRDPFPGMSMPGGLNSPMTMPQQQPSDFGSLFGRGAGGMGGAPQTPSYTSGIAPDQSGGQTLDAPMAGAPSSTMDWSTLFEDSGGMSMPGGLNSPMTAQEPAYDYGSLYGNGTEGAPQQAGTRTYDLAPMFEGGGGGFGTGGAETSQLFGANNAGSLGGNAFDTNPAEMSGAQDVFPQTADAMVEQARARLASVISGSDRPIELKTDANDMVIPDQPVAPTAAPEPAVEPPPASPFDNVPQPVTPDAATPATDVYPGRENPPRPPADVPQRETRTERQGMAGKSLEGVHPKLAAAVRGGATFLPPGYTVEAYSGLRTSKTSSQGHHRTGNAIDIQIRDPNGNAISNEGRDTTGMYTKLAQGVKAWTQANDPELMSKLRYGGAFGTKIGGGGVPDLMHYDLGLWANKGNYGSMRPEVGMGVLQPMSAEDQRASLGSQIQSGIAAEGRAYADQNAPLADRPAAATVEERPGVNRGQTISSPPADIPPAGLVGGGFNALDAAANPPAPVKHSGLELARANIDTPIEKIAMERGGQKAVDQISSMAVGMTPRQLYQSYGGMFMSRAEPLFASLGITRQDFEQAIKQSPTRQDLKMRFGGEFGGGGGEPSAGAFSPFEGFRESADFEDRRNELAQLQTGGASYDAGPEVAPTPLSGALGLEDLPMPAASGRNFDDVFNAFQPAPTRDDLAAVAPNNGFSRYSDEGYGTSTGRAPPVNLSPEHMRTMAQIESGQNPKDVTGSYRGLYNLKESEFRKYGGQGSIFNPEENTRAATAKMATESQRAQDTLGRALSPVEQYLVHQQGLAGTLSHIANPDQPAWKSWQQAASSSEAKAKEVIWGNLPDAVKDQFGSVNNITSRDFINAWNTFYYQKMVESGLSPGGLSDLP